MKKSKLLKTFFATVAAVLVCAFAVGCAAKSDYNGGWDYSDGYGYYDYDGGSDFNVFDEIIENPFVACTEENNTQAVSLTVNTAAFPIMRRYLNNGMSIPKNAVKIEEIINYFEYDYLFPEDGETISTVGAVIDTPWNEKTKLVMLGAQAKTANVSDISNNVVLLADVSGSMQGKDRLDLVKESFSALTDTLDNNDIVSIVTYASGSQIVLDGARGDDKNTIKSALSSLTAGGSTNGAGGIDKAYEAAFKYRDYCDNSIILIATDGDFNVGASTPEALKELISENRRKGVYLSALGFGFDNLSDSNMQQIVAAGQGAYRYIDSLDTAREALIGNKDSVMYFVAEEAKAQVAFNPETVEKFRLIGYENKMLTAEEFEDPNTPAGALSSGSQVTAVFEIELKEDAQTDNVGKFTVAYRERGGAEEKRTELALGGGLSGAEIKQADADFISAVVETSLVIRKSDYAGSGSYDSALSKLESLNLNQSDRKYEFVEFLKKLIEKE